MRVTTCSQGNIRSSTVNFGARIDSGSAVYGSSEGVAAGLGEGEPDVADAIAAFGLGEMFV
jgi:hypothetical protein